MQIDQSPSKSSTLRSYQNNIRTNRESNSEKFVINRSTKMFAKIYTALLIFTILNICLQLPTSEAFSHTSYRSCSNRVRSKLNGKCDFRLNYCGYYVIRLPRGGIEKSDCIRKRESGLSCKFGEQCMSDSCFSGKCT